MLSPMNPSALNNSNNYANYPSSAPQPPSLNSLRNVVKQLDSHFNYDDHFPDVEDLIEATGPAASAEYSFVPQKEAWNVAVRKNNIILPDALFEQLDFLQCRCFMGVFPEIQRAWITVDHRLFIWNYMDGNDFHTYEECDQVIVGVGLVKPKQDVFTDTVEYLLILSTPLEIHLLGLTLSSGKHAATNQRQPANLNSSEITLYVTQISTPSDGINMTCIVGTRTGRVFMCGGDGRLWELTYQAEEGWFRRKCNKEHRTGSTSYYLPSVLTWRREEQLKQIAYDGTRDLLYTLSDKSTIEVFNLGQDDKQFQHVAKLTDVHKVVASRYPSLAPYCDPSKSFHIVDIHAIPSWDSRNIHLVAVTSNALRLYFSTDRGIESQGLRKTERSRFDGLILVSARRPYGSQNTGMDSAPLGKSSPEYRVHSSFYATGMCLLANNGGGMLDDDAVGGFGGRSGGIGGMDKLVSFGLDEGRIAAQSANAQPTILTETAGTLSLQGTTWCIAEVGSPVHGTGHGGECPPSYLRKSSGTRLPEIATQFVNPPREFLVMTNTGMSIVAKQRPLDILTSLLSAPDFTEEDFLPFVNVYGRKESCCMALSILCSNLQVERASPHRRNAISSPADPIVLGAQRIYFEQGGNPEQREQSYALNSQAAGVPMPVTETMFSWRHEGTMLYFSRLLRRIWKQKVTRKEPTAADANRQNTNVPVLRLVDVQRELSALKLFLDQNPQLTNRQMPDYHAYGASQQQHLHHLDPQIGARQSEANSYHELQLLIVQVIEAISFVMLLIDYKLPETIQSIPQSSQQDLLELTYEGLITSVKGKQLVRDLVTAIINERAVDAVSEVLQQRCGLFCSPEDVVLYKAIENLRKAKDTMDLNERREVLHESLRLFLEVARHINIDKLQNIVNDYMRMGFFDGAIEVGVRCAESGDQDNFAIAYYKDGMNSSSDVRADSFRRRVKCYDIVFEMIQRVISDSQKAKMHHSSVKGPDGAILSPDDAEARRVELLQYAMSTGDELFHYRLYDAFMEHGMSDQLLEMPGGYLESWLKQNPTLDRMELLWQYYVRIGDHIHAALVLNQLAESSEYGLDLETRVTHLTSAARNAKSVSAGDREAAASLLHELEDKLEVAQVQLEMQGELKHAGDAEEAVAEMDTRLMDISTLFNNIAAPLGMFEAVLRILHVSGHKDVRTVKTTWLDIINQTHDDAMNHGIKPLDALHSKVYALGKKYYPSDFAFPLEVVCNLLEFHHLQHREDMVPGWVARTLRKVGVPFDVLFDVYHRQFEMRIPPWQSIEPLSFLVEEIFILLQDWLQFVSEPTTSNAERETFPARAVDDALGAYIMLLTASSKDLCKELEKLRTFIRSKF